VSLIAGGLVSPLGYVHSLPNWPYTKLYESNIPVRVAVRRFLCNKLLIQEVKKSLIQVQTCLFTVIVT